MIPRLSPGKPEMHRELGESFSLVVMAASTTLDKNNHDHYIY